MSSSYLQTDLKNETKNFKAFERLTTGLKRLDDYQESQNKERLKEASGFISEALEADKDYFKANYFQAVVNYLQGKDADFKKLLNSEPPPEVRNEINYNIAVVNAAEGKFKSAITKFDEVINGKPDPEIKLLAHAGLALSCKRRIDEANETPDLYKKKLDEQLPAIEKILAGEEEKLITDEVVTEVERIMSEVLNEAVIFRRSDKPKGAPVLSRRLLKRALLIIGSIILVLIILWLYLYVGLNDSSGF